MPRRLVAVQYTCTVHGIDTTAWVRACVCSVDRVVALLQREQFHVAALHGHLPQDYRFRVMQAFRDGKVGNAGGRGTQLAADTWALVCVCVCVCVCVQRLWMCW